MTVSTTIALAALAELERRFNGPIPEPLRRAARLGSAERVELLHAEGQRAFFRSMLRGQVRIIRQRRLDGSFYPALLADLALYREGWRRWHRMACALGKAAAAPSDTAAMAAE